MAKKKHDYSKAYTVRFHNADMEEKVNKIYDKFKNYYSSFSEFMAWMCFEGATNKDGQEDLNKAFNYSEIRKILKRLESDKENDLEVKKMLKAELLAEIRTNQALLNFIIRLLYELHFREFSNLYRQEGKFNSLFDDEIEELTNKILLEVYDGK